MKISQLGEFGLLKHISKLLETSSKQQPNQLVKGIGDDGAAWRSSDTLQIVSTDIMLENIHFTCDSISFRELGYKALAVNLSDIAAMGGMPRYALISLALPPATELEDALDLYRGMIEVAERYNTAIIGGDTSSSDTIMLSITIGGEAFSPDNLLTRDNAKPGDMIGVSGHLGGAAAGLRLLNDKKQARNIPVELAKAFYCPIPRFKLAELLVKYGVNTTIDISDGLLIDLGHILESSGSSATIETGKIPLYTTAVAAFGSEALALALYGGEDYELLFTAPKKVMDMIIKDAPCLISIIGEIGDGKVGKIELHDKKGKPITAHKKGWEHFSND